MSVLIWWTSQTECDSIGASLPSTIPDYIREEYASRYGRSGRGRLWISRIFNGDDDADKEILSAGVSFDSNTPLIRFIESHCAGIVISRGHVRCLAELPGIITTARLKRA